MPTVPGLLEILISGERLLSRQPCQIQASHFQSHTRDPLLFRQNPRQIEIQMPQWIGSI